MAKEDSKITQISTPYVFRCLFTGVITSFVTYMYVSLENKEKSEMRLIWL